MDFIKGKTRLVKRMRRQATAWAFGSGGRYALDNRFGNGSKPGRENYAIHMAYDATATEPELDHGQAHTSFYTRVARIFRSSKRKAFNPARRFTASSPRVQIRRVR